MVETRTVKVFLVPHSQMGQLLNGEIVRASAGFPEDAVVEYVFTDLMRNCVALTVNHPSFAQVPINESPPTVCVGFEVLHEQPEGQWYRLGAFGGWQPDSPIRIDL